ncbi:myotubularin-related protein 14-like isoform X2 [Corticium candelabrum]|uniref:myotubularin-related protein 14-like isoform X2 n=1 Tax=Corticium candelabrum TaxID=121492 RepID=UPI002E263762|nr:myotubularin-related protein 14-like isoform X2 [Corticium candelabrum]
MNSGSSLDRRSVEFLLSHFSKNTYKARTGDSQSEVVLMRCIQLFTRDYGVEIVSNTSGELCAQYPGKIVILDTRQKETPSTDTTKSEATGNHPREQSTPISVEQLSDLMQKARLARCRTRFIVPVILYGNKYVCRSSTLSSGAELYGRSGLDWLFTRGNDAATATDDSDSLKSIARAAVGDWELFDRIRGDDIRLLKALGVEYICDLMVEQKKVKYGMTVTSSEKVDKARRYAEFHILSIPYPGCELFAELKSCDYSYDKVHFDWTQSFVNATMDIPADVMDRLSIDWKNYKMWDLTRITQNYLKLFLYLLHSGEGSLLIHCISGWDRTPLFISLLRLSLWADGAIHQSLTALEIVYLTLAYDWLLFGHQLSTRLSKGEEILFFCFHFLNHIYSDEYSITKIHRNPINHFDSELFLEGMVQEVIGQGGSTTSLNSTSSSGSSYGVVNSSTNYTVGPVCGAQDATLTTQNEGLRPTSHWSPQQLHRKPPFFKNECSVKSASAADASMSSPISVPLVAATSKSAENSPSSHCGSWQLISSSGSPLGTATSRSSPQTVRQQSLTPAPEIEHNVSNRRQRLGEVRDLFLSSYYATIHSSTHHEQRTTASLMGNVAGMVSRLSGYIGVEGARGTSV